MVCTTSRNALRLLSIAVNRLGELSVSYHLHKNKTVLLCSYRLVQTEVCNISGTSYHKALCSIRMFPHPFRLHAHWHRRVAFLFYAHTPIRYCTSSYTHNAQPPIRIFARLYIRLCTRIYTALHVHIYRFARAYIRICTCIYTDLHVHIYRFARAYIRKCTSAYTFFVSDVLIRRFLSG